MSGPEHYREAERLLQRAEDYPQELGEYAAHAIAEGRGI